MRKAGIQSPELDLKILQKNFEGKAYERAFAQRAARQPMSQILGFRDFWKDRFIVTEDVLDPRPDSELFIEVALEWNRDFSHILDLGTGSGALGLSLLREFSDAKALLVDQSSDAIQVAEKNILELGLSDRAQTTESDWFSNVQGQFDLIICNPPYLSNREYEVAQEELKFEPKNALTDGGNGLAHYKNIARDLNRYLTKNGLALFEHGHQQQEKVAEIFVKQGFEIQKHKDLSENPRLIAVFLIKL